MPKKSARKQRLTPQQWQYDHPTNATQEEKKINLFREIKNYIIDTGISIFTFCYELIRALSRE
jgi:phage gp29-like protein